MVESEIDAAAQEIIVGQVMRVSYEPEHIAVSRLAKLQHVVATMQLSTSLTCRVMRLPDLQPGCIACLCCPCPC